MTVTRDDPGGDAFDPHAAALGRLLDEAWARRRDPWQHVRVPLADEPHWSYTHFALIDHFVAFRYGDDYHALSAVFVRDVPEGTPATSGECLLLHDEWMFGLLRTFGVAVSEVETTLTEWQDRHLFVRSAEAELDYGVGQSRVSTAWAAYPAYPTACLVIGISVFHRGHGVLARKVRDRWVSDGAQRLLLTKPERPPHPP